jgi:hypothetical protein
MTNQRKISEAPRLRRVAPLGAALRSAVALLLLLPGCGGSDDPEAQSEPKTSSATTSTSSQQLFGQCARDELVLRSPEPTSCAVDSACPCGSYCDLADHVCKFTCMVPPASSAESCAAGTQCDDTGRCVGPGTAPPDEAVQVASLPSVLAVAPAAGGTSQLTAQLRLTSSAAAALTRALTTVVQVTASEGLQVSCNASTFGPSCALSGWTFSWDGTRHNANRTVWVRSLSSNTEAEGQVRLLVDDLAIETSIPTHSAVPEAFEGLYRGTAAAAGLATGVPVTVLARGDLLLVRDATQTMAPKGAIVLDYLDAVSDVATARRMTWLQPLGAAPAAGAMIGEVKANGLATRDAATGALSAGFTIQLPGLAADSWTLQLQRSSDLVAECTTTADCSAGTECVGALQACVPTEAWTPPVAALENSFEDPRSASWWTATSAMLGTGDSAPTGDAKPAFATTGADMIEALLCSTNETEANAGRLGVTQLQQAGVTRSGDLACVSGAPPGSPTISPGAVGLATYRDRHTTNDTALALLDTCLQDLARTPTTTWPPNYGSTIGQCANLARFVPALRLLSTSELEKRTRATGSPRLRGLLVRLLQQWSQLHGFLASTGLSEREYDDAIAASLSEGRQELLDLLDVLDAGWAALLDKRVASTVAAAATWAPTDTSNVNDYRTAKQPVAYWAFNGPSGTPQRDLVRGIDLVPIAASTKVGCQIRTDRTSIAGDWNCPGFTATLPATAPSIAGNNDLTVSMFVNSPTAEFPPYFGGTMFMTETLAAVAVPLPSATAPGISFVHPTADGGTEWVAFDWVYGFTSSSFAVVRDTTTMTYTLYVWQAWGTTPQALIFTQRYYQPVGGRLNVASRTIRLGGGQWPHPAAYPGLIDDFAIFDAALSKREVQRFQIARGANATRRDTWPNAMSLLAPPVPSTQELTAPVGASLLEAQIAHLDVVARLAEHLTYEAPAACGNGDTVARADLDAAVARAGRTLRQSAAIEGLVAGDLSDRAQKARQQLRAKRSKIVRTLQALHTCDDPYGLDDNEVPLYFGDLNGETEAFFAASDYLLSLAQARSADAVTALNDVRARWDAARQSKIQEQYNAQSRAIRVGEQEARFGEQLKRLCGITERTTQQIIQQVKDGTFVVDTCFVSPTTACQAQLSNVTIMDADPTCYRGIIGAQLMDMRAAYYSQQSAYQAWQAAAGNAAGAERQCVLKEMDLHGCSALDRHELTGVTCPPHFVGTVELTRRFNESMSSMESSRGWLSAIVGAATTVATVVTTAGVAGPIFLGIAGGLGSIGPLFQGSAEETRRTYEATLAQRAAEDEIRDCWAQAEQYRRAIAVAEQTSNEAMARMHVAIIQHQNAVSEAREILLEAPVAIDREATRPSIPVAFHYWLPDEIFHYRFQLAAARRYTYMALRATEYDLQQKFVAPPDQTTQPSRAAVVGAWRPATLIQQLALLQTATAARKTGGGRPAKAHMVVHVGRDLFGLDASDPDLGTHLQANARPVYSTRGEYLGEGVRFSFIPQSGSSAPVWRCAERLWRANVGRAADVVGSVRVKLLKRTVFASRDCHGDAGQLQVSTLHPEKNLLAAGGEPFPYEDQAKHTVADIDVVDLNIAGNNEGFHSVADFFNGSSTELAGQGLFGDYVLLFTAPTLTAGLTLESVHELYVRFDFLSVDNLPSTFGLTRLAGLFGVPPSAAPPGELTLQPGDGPIIVD